MSEIPFCDRLTCTVPAAIAATGISRTKLYGLKARGLVEMIKIDGRALVVVASLKRLTQRGTDSGQQAA